jgi:hypothetical protein
LEDDTRATILKLLAEGQSLSAICRADGMPSREAVRLWQRDDPEFDLAVTHAREDGLEKRADEAIQAARDAKDAALGRLAFDADRWYIGKLSNAFSDKQKHEHTGANGRPIETVSRIERHVIDPANPDSKGVPSAP